MSGLNSYGSQLGFTPNKTNLNPGQNIQDPNKVLTQQGGLAQQTVTKNLQNPGAPLTGLGYQAQQKTQENLSNPQGNTTSFGNTYDTNLKKEADSGQLYGMQNQEALTGRANALNTSRTQNTTAESLASQGIRPGTAAFSRAQNVANSGAQSANLDRTQALNANEVAASKDINARLAGREALGYGKEQTALGQANTVENNARNVQTNAVNQGNTLETNQYNKNENQIQQQNTARLENKGDTQSIINSVQDPKTKALLQSVMAQGGDVKAAYAQLTGSTPDANGNIQANAGTINPNFAGATPAAAEKQGLLDETKQYNPQKPGESDADYNSRIQNMVNTRGNQINDQKYNPLNTTADAEQATAVRQKLNTLPKDAFLSADDFDAARKNGVVPQYSAANIPSGGDGVNKFLLDNPSGVISLGGSQYKVISGGSPTTRYTNFGNPRHTDVTLVKDAQGNTKYIWGGKIQDQGPKDVGGHYWDLPGMEGSNGTWKG